MIDLFYLFTIFMRMNRVSYAESYSAGDYDFDPIRDFLEWIEIYAYDLPKYQNCDINGIGDWCDQMIEMIFKHLADKVVKRE